MFLAQILFALAILKADATTLKKSGESIEQRIKEFEGLCLLWDLINEKIEKHKHHLDSDSTLMNELRDLDSILDAIQEQLKPGTSIYKPGSTI